MYHLIYTSRALDHFSAADLKKLLMRSRPNNGRDNVTGMLIYQDGAFLQVLEGDEASVRRIFNRIERDPRHASVEILASRKSLGERRVFGEWSMGFANATNNAQVLKGFVDLSAGQDLRSLTEQQAMDVLSSCGATKQYEAA